MDILKIIDKKRKGLTLSKEEIDFFVKSATDEKIPDYQISALLMAICINGMNKEETFNLTVSMLNSGEIVDLSKIKGIKVDKHSTGGVSDTTSIALIPILACANLVSVKMSGRGLGFTGGTIDKLETFENIKLDFTKKEIIDQVNELGCIICSQSSNLAPADKKLYAIRDITSTVESIPLIASSIMSKKLASGNDLIFLDVKIGNGAFMKDLKSAKILASLMVEIGKMYNKKICAAITDMNQPLGNGIGCALEIKDAIDVLQGKQNRLADLVQYIATKIMVLSGKYTEKNALQKYDEIIKSNLAYKKFLEMIEYQNGDASIIENKITKMKPTDIFTSDIEGYVESYDTQKLGMLVCDMGGGKKTLKDTINHFCGIYAYKKIGDKVSKDDILFDIYNGKKMSIPEIKTELASCIKISKKKPKNIPKLVFAFIS